MREIKFKEIIIDQKIRHLPLTQNILENIKGTPVKYVEDGNAFKESQRSLSFTQGERILHITEYKGRFTKLCPGSSEDHACCNYHVITGGTGCPMECTYCFLQEFLNNPILTVYANIDKIFEEIDEMLGNEPFRLFRIGTGELSDSLVIDQLSGFTKSLISYFSCKTNAILELKTKTPFIDHLLPFHSPNVVFSWSLNPSEVITDEEHKTASLFERLSAAKRAQDAGFKVGIHLDPIIYIDDWEDAYFKLIEMIFSTLDPRNIIWISIGSLRFAPGLKTIVKKRFPKSTIMYAEQIRGIDGKVRYVKPLRLNMYQKIYRWIRDQSDTVFCYFCMEKWDVWQKVMGYYPETHSELDYQFARSIYARFPDLEIERPLRSYYIKGD